MLPSPSGLAYACTLLLPTLLCRAELPAQAAASVEPVVHRERVPNGGIQPQLARGADGTLHLVYFTGDAAAGDLCYCRRGPNEIRFAPAIRVNSEPASAVAVGTIRGAQVALGKDDCIHVVWNGSDRSLPRGPKGEAPVLYTHLAAGGAFVPQRNVGGKVTNLDGGACLAADRTGHVYVAWHAGESEETRRVWVARSDDGGATFAAARAIDKDRVGACACCGMYGFAAGDGEIQFLYRAARDKVHRDIYLLASADGTDWKSRKLDPWEGKTCPMSSAAIEHAPGGDWAAWETGAQVCFAQLGEKNRKGGAASPPGEGNGRKHPRLAANAAGQVLLVWTEGTGWKRGGRLAWQLYDAVGIALPTKGETDGIPMWSFAAAAALPNGDFLVLH